MTDVVLYHRDARGALQAVLPVAALEWTRRFTGSGRFRLDLPLTSGATQLSGHVVDVELDGRTDFSGVIQRRALTFEPGRELIWRLEGMDLTWWLHQRVIVPPAGQSHDEQLGVPAETAMRHYTETHLISPVDSARTIPIAAALEPAHVPALGPSVSVRARYGNLAREVERIATAAGLSYGAERLRILVQPPVLGPYRYRDDWDVGDIVSIDPPDLALRVDQRVDSVRCRADAGEPLEISCAFGAAPPDAATALRRLDERTAPGRFV